MTDTSREALIKRLAEQWATLDQADPYRADIGLAVDMLEADRVVAVQYEGTCRWQAEQIEKLLNERDALMQAAKLALTALNRAVPLNERQVSEQTEAIEALKKAGVNHG